MHPQNRKILQTGLYGGRHTNVGKFSREQKNIFVLFSHITFILGKFTNFKKFFPVVSIDFR